MFDENCAYVSAMSVYPIKIKCHRVRIKCAQIFVDIEKLHQSRTTEDSGKILLCSVN